MADLNLRVCSCVGDVTAEEANAIKKSIAAIKDGTNKQRLSEVPPINAGFACCALVIQVAHMPFLTHMAMQCNVCLGIQVSVVGVTCAASVFDCLDEYAFPV